MLLLLSADFSKLTLSQSSFVINISVSKCLHPDQDRHSVGPDLGPNCLQRLSADDKSLLTRKELKKQQNVKMSPVANFRWRFLQQSICQFLAKAS